MILAEYVPHQQHNLPLQEECMWFDERPNLRWKPVFSEMRNPIVVPWRADLMESVIVIVVHCQLEWSMDFECHHQRTRHLQRFDLYQNYWGGISLRCSTIECWEKFGFNEQCKLDQLMWQSQSTTNELSTLPMMTMIYTHYKQLVLRLWMVL